MVESIIVPDSEQVKPPVLCLCCDSPATVALADWDVCDICYNILMAPFPAEIPFDGIAPTDDDAVDGYGLEEPTL